MYFIKAIINEKDRAEKAADTIMNNSNALEMELRQTKRKLYGKKKEQNCYELECKTMMNDEKINYLRRLFCEIQAVKVSDDGIFEY